jgi:hypothetical protein
MPIVDEIGDAEIIERAFMPTPRWVRHVTDNSEMPLVGPPDGIAVNPVTAGPAGKFRLRTLSHVPAG